MSHFRVSVAISSTLQTGSALAASAFPNLAAAVRVITEAAHRKWVEHAQGAPLPDGRRVNNRTGAYARSIQLRQLNDFSGEVYTELGYADAIENGTPARDLHDMLGSSLKVRLTKAGKRYLIIPFRYDRPNSVLGPSMPQPIYDWWRGPSIISSAIVSTHTRVSGTGAYDIKTRQPLHVPARKYNWGTQLKPETIRQMGLGEDAVKRFANMYRFDRPPEPGARGGGHQQFITFRTMMEGSPGWRVPARPGLNVAQSVADEIRPIAEEAFPRAVEIDIRRMLGQR